MKKVSKAIRGSDGIGVKSAYIDERGHLILVLTDGTEIDAGKVTQGVTEGLEYNLYWNEYYGGMFAEVAGI